MESAEPLEAFAPHHHAYGLTNAVLPQAVCEQLLEQLSLGVDPPQRMKIPLGMSVAIAPCHLLRPPVMQLDPPPAEDHPCRGVLSERSNHPPDAAGIEAIVGVQELHKRAAGLCDRGVRVLSLSDRLPVHEQTHVTTEVVPQEVGRPVDGSVIDNDHLQIVVILVQGRLDRRDNGLGGVVGRNADRHQLRDGREIPDRRRVGWRGLGDPMERDMTDTSISIVVPTHGRPGALRLTVAALLRLEMPSDWELIVVDNSGDRATEKVVTQASKVRKQVHYELFTAGGAAAARNRGAEIAGGHWLVFCDDDVIPVQPDHLVRHLSAHESHPRSFVTGEWTFLPALERQLRETAFGRFRLELERGFQREVQAYPLDGGRFELDFAASNNMSVERSLFREIGGFDPAIPYAGAEDQDLSLRARSSGCTLVLDRSIRLHHNDRRLTLIDLCIREERSAQTAVVLARNFPLDCGDRELLSENGPIGNRDRVLTVAKKLIKAALSRELPLRLLHRLIGVTERMPLTDETLWRLYRAVVGVHVFRGIRVALRSHRGPGR